MGSSRIGAKWTLLVGLVGLVVFAALAGASDSIGGIVGFRAGWGVGNALFIATSLAVIVASATGGFVGAIILYEAALGVGIAVGPLLGGLLGNISWRGPFYGVAVLMAIAAIATLVLLEPTAKPARKTGFLEPLKALRHRGLATLSLTALCYNWAFLTVLGYAPFPMGSAPSSWASCSPGGVCWSRSSPCSARLVCRHGLASRGPRGDRRRGVHRRQQHRHHAGGHDHRARRTAVAYGFVRFIGGGLAPFVAGELVEATNVHVPFYLGALLLGIAILRTARTQLDAAEQGRTEAR